MFVENPSSALRTPPGSYVGLREQTATIAPRWGAGRIRLVSIEIAPSGVPASCATPATDTKAHNLDNDGHLSISFPPRKEAIWLLP